MDEKLTAHVQSKYTQLVSDAELKNGVFVCDGRAACVAQNKNPEEWIEHVNNLYRDYHGRIFDAEGHEVILNMDVFETPFIREWFRDFACTPCRPGIRPRIRAEAKPRVRVLFTLMRAHFPESAKLWGARPANDNDPDMEKRHSS